MPYTAKYLNSKLYITNKNTDLLSLETFPVRKLADHTD